MAKKTFKKKKEKKTSRNTKQSKEKPVVAKAIKMIPGYYLKKTKKWVKAHPRTISLTIGTLATLYFAYLANKMGINKMRKMHHKTLADQRERQKKLDYNLAMGQIKLSKRAQEQKQMQEQLGKGVNILDRGTSNVEKAIRGKDFHEYLKENHNIVGLKRVNKQ